MLYDHYPLIARHKKVSWQKHESAHRNGFVDIGRGISRDYAPRFGLGKTPIIHD